MNRISNRLIRAGAVAGTIGVLCVPAFGSALSTRSGVTDGTAAASVKTSPFCGKLGADDSNINSKISDLTGKISQAWTTQEQKLSSESQSVDQKVAANRAAIDAQRQENFTKLEAKATTGTQQDAVKAYETAVDNAVNTRRAAYNSARAAFRVGVGDAILSRHSTVSGQESTFQGSVNSAISTAQAACTSNPGSTSARAAFVASLKSARQTFQGERGADSKTANQAKQLAVTRDNAFKAADKTFQSAMQSARQTLEHAFGKTSV